MSTGVPPRSPGNADVGRWRLLEGVVDLAYEHEGTWTVVDFKTDEDPSRELDAYSRQVGLYAAGLALVCGGASRGAVLVI